MKNRGGEAAADRGEGERDREVGGREPGPEALLLHRRERGQVRAPLVWGYSSGCACQACTVRNYVLRVLILVANARISHLSCGIFWFSAGGCDRRD